MRDAICNSDFLYSESCLLRFIALHRIATNLDAILDDALSGDRTMPVLSAMLEFMRITGLVVLQREIQVTQCALDLARDLLTIRLTII